MIGRKNNIKNAFNYDAEVSIRAMVLHNKQLVRRLSIEKTEQW